MELLQFTPSENLVQYLHFAPHECGQENLSFNVCLWLFSGLSKLYYWRIYEWHCLCGSGYLRLKF